MLPILYYLPRFCANVGASRATLFLTATRWPTSIGPTTMCKQARKLQPWRFAGEKQSVSFSLAHDHIALRYWDDSAGQFAFEPGTLQLMVGSSSASIHLRGHVDLV